MGCDGDSGLVFTGSVDWAAACVFDGRRADRVGVRHDARVPDGERHEGERRVNGRVGPNVRRRDDVREFEVRDVGRVSGECFARVWGGVRGKPRLECLPLADASRGSQLFWESGSAGPEGPTA